MLLSPGEPTAVAPGGHTDPAAPHDTSGATRVGLSLRRVQRRWHVDAIERGVCREG